MFTARPLLSAGRWRSDSEADEDLVNFRQLSVVEAEAIVKWRYPEEYSAYDVSGPSMESTINYMADPANRFLGVYENAELIGFCSIGNDGQVPGGTYDDSALDLGAGMRPDLTGRHGGARFLQGVVEFVESETGGSSLRATIASWNERALRVAEAVGFIPQTKFLRSDGQEFTILVRGGGCARVAPPNTAMEPPTRN